MLPFSCFDNEDSFSFKVYNFQIMASNLSMNWNESGVLYVEQSSNDQSLPRRNTPVVRNPTKMSGSDTGEMISLSSIASLEPQIVTIDSNSNEPTMPYKFGWQLPNIPTSLNDLNLPPNSFNILATMAVVNQEDGYDENYSPQSPEPSEPSPISTHPMNVSTIDGWATPHTTTDDNTLYSDDEPRRKHFLPSTPTSPPPPGKLKRKLSLGMTFAKKAGVSQHVCEACGQLLFEQKDIPGSPTTN